MEKHRIIEMDNGVKLINYFNEHFYDVPGIDHKLKSVSMILSIIAKGWSYEEWLKDVGRNADYIVKQAQESGSKLHNAFEMALLGNTISADDGQVQYTKKEWQKYMNWCNWYEGLDIKPYLLENVVFSKELDVAGTFDGVFEIKGTKESDGVWLLDWKTGNSIWETSKLQVAAYATMLNIMIDEGLISCPKITRAGIVHVGAAIKTKKELQNVGVKVEEANIAVEFDNFEMALALFNRFNPDIKAPVDDFPLERKLTKGVLK